MLRTLQRSVRGNHGTPKQSQTLSMGTYAMSPDSFLLPGWVGEPTLADDPTTPFDLDERSLRDS